MKLTSILGLAAILFVTVTSSHAEDQTVVYPTQDNPSFLITAPADWELSPAEEEGGYFDLEGPTGAVFSFRTIEGNEDSLATAIEEAVEYLKTEYNDVVMGEAQDWKPNGLEGFYAVVTGTDKADDEPVKMGIGWVMLGNGEMAEMWFVAAESDTAGMKQAEKIANSLAAP